MLRPVLFVAIFLLPLPLFAQVSSPTQSQEEAELRSVLSKMQKGELSKPEVFSILDEMVEEDRYRSYLGPHIMLSSMSDVYAPQASERVFRRALASLEGKEFVIFMMRQFDRAMELDRNYIYDEERIKKDSKYREFWENRQFYDFSASEFDALAECHEIFAGKDEWRESALREKVAEEPCSKLKNF